MLRLGDALGIGLPALLDREQPSISTITPGTRELLLVIDGHIDLTIGEHTARIDTGDAATFHGDSAHGYADADAATTPERFTLTVHQPHVGTGPERRRWR